MRKVTHQKGRKKAKAREAAGESSGANRQSVGPRDSEIEGAGNAMSRKLQAARAGARGQMPKKNVLAAVDVPVAKKRSRKKNPEKKEEADLDSMINAYKQKYNGASKW